MRSILHELKLEEIVSLREATIRVIIDACKTKAAYIERLEEALRARDQREARLTEALEQIANTPEEGHPINLLKLIAHYALEREPTKAELIAESEIDALEPEESK